MIPRICAKRQGEWRAKVCSAMGRNCGECFGHWILKFGIYLEFGAWNLGFCCFMKLSHSIGLGYTLTFPWSAIAFVDEWGSTEYDSVEIY